MKLISMTDFVLQIVQTPNVNEAICWEQTENRLQKIYHYGLFLKQSLTLGMFVPCDENNRILIEPDEYQDFLKIGQQGIMRWGYNIYNQCLDFHKAKERVLFKGFEWDYENNCFEYALCDSGKWFLGAEDLENETIETFGGIENQIELSENAIKQIGL